MRKDKIADSISKFIVAQKFNPVGLVKSVDDLIDAPERLEKYVFNKNAEVRKQMCNYFSSLEMLMNAEKAYLFDIEEYKYEEDSKLVEIREL